MTQPLSQSPAFAGFPNAVPLSGFSGAFVGLMRAADGRVFVRKAAMTPDTNARLRRQAHRQNWLRTLLSDGVIVPAIEQDGMSDGLYWFDMQFAAGQDACTYLSNMGFNAIPGFAEQIGALIAQLASANAEHAGDSEAFAPALLAKLADIDAKTEQRHAALLRPLFDVAGEQRATIRPTASHGDLTFENIMVDRHHRLWLIDTIDSPVNHYWMDWSKLFQEVEGRWHRHRRHDLSLSISWALRNAFYAAAVAMDPGYRTLHYLLLGITFARILPYANGAEDIAFVSDRIALFARQAQLSVGKSA